MYRSLRSGFLLIVIILVLKAFFPEIASGLIEITSKMIAIISISLDQATETISE